jgi:glycyl-tRNA synthetase
MRPETAQGIYVNVYNVMQAARQRIPFGIAQIGKAFRNEITPGNFTFRTREFEQMEMQFFVKPGTDMEWFEYWKAQRIAWYDGLGIRKTKLHFHEHTPQERAFYAAAAFDIEYEFPFGWKELEGIHNRTNYDLSKHQEYSGKDLSYFDDQTREKYIPYIVETSAGCDRTVLTALIDAYDEDVIEGEARTVLRLAPVIAPIKAGVFPLVKKEGMPEVAEKIFHDLKKHFPVFYDDGGAIGRRYRRMDEAGTPFGITVDGQTLQDQTVTVRERDSLVQTRVAIDKLLPFIQEKMAVYKKAA